tara:strand:- start:8320 stop:9204 length:885 start_codon:yes stop_codon:yes gene_type:complete
MIKGIILAGGLGTRLFPITKVISKQLLCVYDKPMIYYPLSTLLLAGIKDILIISTITDIDNYKNLFGNGKNLGISISYKIQKKPEGIAQAFIIAEEFIGNDNVCLILGDNIFHGFEESNILNTAIDQLNRKGVGTIFGSYVKNPERYGVIKFDKDANPKRIIEKPKKFISNFAVAGLYFYPNSVIEISKTIQPSLRNELEITSVNNIYLEQKKINIKILKPSFTWLDTGTPDSLLEASNFVQTVEKRQGLKIACIEEISLKNNFIDYSKLQKIISKMDINEYSQYLSNLVNNGV